MPVTFDDFVSYIGLDAKFMREQGIEQHKEGVAIPYYGRDGTLLYRKIRANLDGSPKYIFETPGTKQTVYGLNKIRELNKKRSCLLCEGESDSLVLWRHGMMALGVPGSSAYKKIPISALAEFSTIYVSQENDEAGKKFAKECPQYLRNDLGFSGSIKIIEHNGHKDFHEIYVAKPNSFRQEIVRLCRNARTFCPDVRDLLEDWSSLSTEQINFIWPNYVPKGFVTLLAGKGGRGKSFISCRLAASVSSGSAVVPGRRYSREPQKVLFLSTEDDPRYEGGIRSRLSSMGADFANIRSLDIGKWERTSTESFSLTTNGLALFEQILDEWPADLIVVDPVIRFLGDGSLNDNVAIRRMMDRLTKIARARNLAVLAVAHFRKGGGESAVDSVMGASDLINASRSVMLVFPNPKAIPTDEETRNNAFHGCVTHSKTNLFAASPTMTYTIQSTDTGAADFRWGTELDMDGEAVCRLLGTSARDKKASRQLRDFIIGTLDQDLSGMGADLSAVRNAADINFGCSRDIFYSVLEEMERDGLVYRVMTYDQEKGHHKTKLKRR